MNKITMILWGLLIFSLWGIILLIAYKQRDTVYIELSNDLKKSAEVYVKNKKIELGFNESSKIYIKEDENIKKYCINSIIVHKGLFGLDYELFEDCDLKE